MRLLHPVFLSFLIAVASPALAAPVSLPGQVTYRERVALPPAAVLQIQLIDQSLPFASPRLAVEAPIGAGQVPLSFDLTFDDKIIIPDHTYALIAAIKVEGGLIFRNFEPYVVNPLAPASPVLIVTNLVSPPTRQEASSAEPASPPPAIFDTLWTASLVGDSHVSSRNAPSMTLGSDMRAGGSGGCNSWFAQAQMDGDKLRFGGITSTKRACLDAGNALESAYFAGLAATASWQLTGDQLTLFGADGKALLTFVR